MLRDVLLLQKREAEQRFQEPYIDREFNLRRASHAGGLRAGVLPPPEGLGGGWECPPKALGW